MRNTHNSNEETGASFKFRKDHENQIELEVLINLLTANNQSDEILMLITNLRGCIRFLWMEWGSKVGGNWVVEGEDE